LPAVVPPVVGSTASARPHLLYLVHRTPYPPDKGDRIRNFHVLRFLSRRANVHLACLADEGVSEEAAEVLRAQCARVAILRQGPLRWGRALTSLLRGRSITEGAFRSPLLEDTIRRWATDTPFAAALTSASGLAPYLGMPELRHTPCHIDSVDMDSQKWLDYAAAGRGWRRWLYRLEGRRLRALEGRLPARARAVIFVSEAEARLYRQLCAAGRVCAIPNGVDLDYFQPQAGEIEPACVFVGALDYHPNIDAACWFCHEVWPFIRERHKQARLWLVGRRPAPAVRRLGRLPGVELVGQVPDVRPWLSRAAAVVVPLRLARGLQNKVLEALAMGKATVASPPALAALQTRPGAHLLAASSRAEWVEAVSHLLGDEALRRRLGAAGRRFVEEHHDWDRCLGPLASLLGLGELPMEIGCQLGEDVQSGTGGRDVSHLKGANAGRDVAQGARA
jgi:sugar transferase (PEP-CTERM/EpsH1 system associated)